MTKSEETLYERLATLKETDHTLVKVAVLDFAYDLIEECGLTSKQAQEIFGLIGDCGLAVERGLLAAAGDWGRT